MNEYYLNLPQKRMGAGALIFNLKSELLIVKPSYKPYWSIPGGVVEDGESPLEACLREIKEEVGLDFKKLRFVCVDYTADAEKGEALQFIFTATLVDALVAIDGKEIVDYKFVKKEEAFKLVGGNLGKRLPLCWAAAKKGQTIYLENGL